MVLLGEESKEIGEIGCAPTVFDRGGDAVPDQCGGPGERA